MRITTLLVLASALALAACGGSSRPVYSGHEESTKGVPGFDATGKKKSQHVKLGQSYTVGGETYVPRHQPDYVEEGMASWYGPGFHGGKTANGERFDSNELTAAHRTLPLPSIVRVTMLATGKSAYVRVNDRGPFAHSRIIDLSRAAADKIGLLRAGVAKVRVEYMPEESKRFAELLAQGRDPKSIDLASEVMDYGNTAAPTDIARADTRLGDDSIVEAKNDAKPNMPESPTLWEKALPGRQANAADANPVRSDSIESASIASSDLSPPAESKKIAGGSRAASRVGVADPSPFAAMETAARPAPEPTMEVADLSSTSSGQRADAKGVPTAVESGSYVQLGAFQNEANAERLRKQYASLSGLNIIRKTNASGVQLYHVRMGPYDTQQAAAELLKAKAIGADARIIHE